MEEVKKAQKNIINRQGKTLGQQKNVLSGQQKIWMTLLIVIVCISPLFLNTIDDAAAHIARLQGLVDNINQMGILGAIRNWKIYFSMMHGSGYGYPMFYGDILLWPFALALIGLENIGLLGRDSESAFLMYKVILQISLWITFIQAYICQSKAIKNKLIKVTKTSGLDDKDRLFSDKDLSFLIAFFYLMTPYIVMILHNQSYRVAAYGIVPWAIYNLVQILYRSDNKSSGVDKKAAWILGLAVQMWLLLETHLITTLYISIVLMIIYVRYLIVDKSTVKEKIVRTIYIGIAAIICIVLSFRFLTEMLSQLGAGYLVVSNTTNDLGQKYSTQLIGTFIPEWIVVQFGDITGLYDSQKIHFGSVGYVGFYYIGLIILGIAGIVQSNSEAGKLSQIKKLQIIQIIYSIIYFILMGTQIFQKMLEFTQFRYRLNTMLDIGLICIGICWITSEISKKTINKIIKYILIIQSITVFGNIAYSSMLDIGRGDLSIQVGGGAEYLQFNSRYDIFEQTRDDYPLHYNVTGQVTDMLKYKQDFEQNLETIGYDHEYTVEDTGLIYWFDIDKTTLGWLESLQAGSDEGDSEKSLVVPVTYYKGIYKATIEKVGQTEQEELAELSINKSDLGYCQIDDSDIQQVIDKDPDGLRYRITIQYIG